MDEMGEMLETLEHLGLMVKIMGLILVIFCFPFFLTLIVTWFGDRYDR